MDYSFSVVSPTHLLLLTHSKHLPSLIHLMNKLNFSHKELLSLKVSFVVVIFVAVMFTWSESRSVVSDSLPPHGLYSPWNSPGQKTGVSSYSLLHGSSHPRDRISHIESQRILYQLSYQGSPRILEWVAYPFSSSSSWPRIWTRVSCIVGGFFTSWATRGAQEY